MQYAYKYAIILIQKHKQAFIYWKSHFFLWWHPKDGTRTSHHGLFSNIDEVYTAHIGWWEATEPSTIWPAHQSQTDQARSRPMRGLVTGLPRLLVRIAGWGCPRQWVWSRAAQPITGRDQNLTRPIGGRGRVKLALGTKKGSSSVWGIFSSVG